MKKKKYWSGVFAMLGVALIATAVFRDQWIWGTISGLAFLYYGSSLYGTHDMWYYITLFTVGTVFFIALKLGWIK